MDSSPSNQRVNVIVNYEYAASEADELTLRPGEVVRDVERLPGGWWRGELRGRRGMFPDNFVAVCDPSPPRLRSEGPSGRCKVAFSYSPANPDELPLSVGDSLEVLGEVEEGWWQGRSKQGRVGVFPSNFVVLMEKPPARPLSEEAPRLPPKPVKERCRVLFPYTAMNEDELSLEEGEVLTLVSRDGPDRGWWRGELRGRVGLFPDNFVTVIPNSATEVEEKKPDRPPAKNIYPVLNKYSEKTASVKELSTSKTSLHKETVSHKETTHKETHGSRSEQERTVVVESGRNSIDRTDVLDTPDGTGKKPPMPTKKSPTPPAGVGGLFSGLKSKIISSSDKEKWTTVSSSTSSSSGEWDKLDGISASKGAPAAPTTAPPAAPASVPPAAPASAATDGFDNVERNSILNDPRAGRVKAPRRRPPSQALRDDTPQQIGLSNGQHQDAVDKVDAVKPKAREWEKHKVPWMAELKLNQAKKTETGRPRAAGGAAPAGGGAGAGAGGGSTDKMAECGAEARRDATHSLEMSKSMSSITNRLSVVETYEEASSKTRHSLDSNKREAPGAPPAAAPPPAPPASAPPAADPPAPAPAPAPALSSPTAAGRTLTTMIEEIKKPPAPSPPVAGSRTSTDYSTPPAPLTERTVTEKSSVAGERQSVGTTVSASSASERTVTVERRMPEKVAKGTDASEALIAQLSDRILNLERLAEAQSVRFNAAIEELSARLDAESRSRLTLQAELEKLAHCVTQV